MTRDINEWPYRDMEEEFRAWSNAWVETNEATYDDQLGCVPPAAWKSTVFAVGECYTHRESDGRACYAMFVEVDGRYFGKSDALVNFDADKYKAEIRKQFNL